MIDLSTEIEENGMYYYKHQQKLHVGICMTTVAFRLLLLSTEMPALLEPKHSGNGLTGKIMA
ncbi:MAG: hypothetical protein WKF36_11670 [Candidatus Nitrosocosmicus sp.]